MKDEAKRDDFSDLVPKLADSTRESIESYQEKSGPREIVLTWANVGSRSGFACTTDEQGIPRLVVTGEEPGAAGKRIRQRFFMVGQTGAVTKDLVIRSANLKGKKAPTPFGIVTEIDQLLKATIPPAQDEGDKIQRKIDEEAYEWFRVFLAPPEINSVGENVESDTDLGMVIDLVAYARGEVADRLGAKAQEINAQLIKIREHMLYADSLGSQTDQVWPRVSFVIVVKTKDGNTALGVLRGSGGTIKDVLARFTEDTSEEARKPKKVISKLVDQVVKEAIDLDRAQTTSVIGASECPIILSPQVAGVLAHEVMGHPAEADIICDNRRRPAKAIGLQLKARIGAQVSEFPRLCIIDTPDSEVKFGDRVIRFNWGSLPVDEYGNHGKNVTIVENGTMVGVMVDRHTFNEIIDGLRDPEQIKNTGITGNVRREKADLDPLIRMRNTFILPDPDGPSSKEEMAKKIPLTKKGLYVKSCNGGSVNPDTGDFQIDANLCYLIENGIITDKPIRKVTIAGNIKQTSLIKAVGNSSTMHHNFSGWCGKNGQSVPVDGGGPIIYIENASIGGGSFRPWLDLVKDYNLQHREVKEGKRGPESINLPEFRGLVGDTEPQHNVCLVTAVLPEGEELRYLMGTNDFSTHEVDDKGRLIERRDQYE